MIGCMGFPDCRSVIWLPSGIVEAIVADTTCPRVGHSHFSLYFFRHLQRRFCGAQILLVLNQHQK